VGGVDGVVDAEAARGAGGFMGPAWDAAEGVGAT
jgi:hypothetical protein